MLSNGKALYQAKLILDYLPEEEYKLIPKEDIDYIENNFEYDENIVINPDISLEEQNIDDRTYEILEKIVKKAEDNKKTEYNNAEVSKYANNAKKSNEKYDVQMENIRLKELVELLKKENSKIPKVKELVKDYKDELENANKKIKALEKNNQYLSELINKIPKFIRKIFIKEDIKMLDEVK